MNRIWKTIASCGLFYIAAAIVGCSSAKESVDANVVMASSDVISAVNASSFAIKTFSAEGVINIASPRLSQSVGFQLEMKKPDSVKIVIEGPFGITVGQALLTKDRFVAYNAVQNSVYMGRTDTKAGFMKMIDIPPSIFVDALSGVRRFDSEQAVPDSFSVSGSTYIFQFVDQSFIKKYVVGILSNRIVRVDRINKENNKLVWREEYEYEKGETTWEPASATIFIPEKETTVEIVYNSISVNTSIPALTIHYPDDAERVTIQ